jgi:dethiobiotin synthetase
MKTLFITGTDTEIGKTYTTCLLARYLAAKQQSVICFKPVAAGAQMIDGKLKNDDALALQAASNLRLHYSQVNPFCFAEPIAPHIAAEQEQRPVTLADIRSAYLQLPQADYCLVEGAGGFLVPLNSHESFADIPAELNASVILVVGMRLGCINHALLSAEAISHRGLTLVGWIANQIDPTMRHYNNNLATVQQRLAAPLLADIAYGQRELKPIQKIHSLLLR